MIFQVENSLEHGDTFRASHPSSEQPLLTRGCLFGDGFFTTGLISRGKILQESLHWERIKQSSEKLRFEFDFKALESRLNVSIKGIEDAGFRITFTRSQKLRGYAVAENSEIIIVLQLFPCPQKIVDPCELLLAKTPISVNPFLAGIKHLNRLDNVMAASEINESNQEVLMCNNRYVVCGSKTNVFFKIDNKWITPELHDCGIEGITRRQVLSHFEEQGIDYSIESVVAQELNRVTAAFVTNSLVGIWPVSIILGREISLEESHSIKLKFECQN